MAIGTTTNSSLSYGARHEHWFWRLHSGERADRAKAPWNAVARLRRAVRWFAGLPLTTVAVTSLWLGLIASYTWGMHWVLLVGAVPVAMWVELQRVV